MWGQDVGGETNKYGWALNAKFILEYEFKLKTVKWVPTPFSLSVSAWKDSISIFIPQFNTVRYLKWSNFSYLLGSSYQHYEFCILQVTGKTQNSACFVLLPENNRNETLIFWNRKQILKTELLYVLWKIVTGTAMLLKILLPPTQASKWCI